MTHQSREARMEPDHGHHHGPCQVSSRAGDSQGHPAPAAGGHSPFQVGSDPHVGQLPAHSCNLRGQPVSVQRRTGISTKGRSLPWTEGSMAWGKTEAGGQAWCFSSFPRLEGGDGPWESHRRSLYLPCQSRGCFHLSTGRPNAGRCSI